MAGSLTGEDNQTQLQRLCDGPYRESVGVETGQQVICPGSYEAALAQLAKEELWLRGYGNT
jgi:hypothetical protein